MTWNPRRIKRSVRVAALPAVALLPVSAGYAQQQADGAAGRSAYQQRMQQTVDDVLASGQYGESSGEGEWVRRVIDWFRSLFEGVGNAADSLPVWALWTIIIFCSAIVLAVVLHAIWTAYVSIRSTDGDDLIVFDAEPAAQGPLLGIRELDAAVVAKQAREYFAAGRTEMALRYFYAAMILQLDQLRRLRYQPSKTNRDYLRELPSQDPAYPAFDHVTRAFESAVYGRLGATQDDCRFADDALQTLETEQRTP